MNTERGKRPTTNNQDYQDNMFQARLFAIPIKEESRWMNWFVPQGKISKYTKFP